jgi:hypothetical protein
MKKNIIFLACLLILSLVRFAPAEEAVAALGATATAVTKDAPQEATATAKEAAKDAPQNSTATAAQSVKDEEIPAPPEGARDTSGEVSKMPLPMVEEKIDIPTKEFVWKPKAKGFPFAETGLAALGGGMFGAFAGLLMPAADPTNKSSVGPNVAIYGGAGLVIGGVLGYLLSHTDPVKLKPPEPTTSLRLDVGPQGPALCLSRSW